MGKVLRRPWCTLLLRRPWCTLSQSLIPLLLQKSVTLSLSISLSQFGTLYRNAEQKAIDEPKADAKAPEAPVKVHEVPPRYEMGVLADYDMGVLFLHDTMGSWSIRCYRIGKRGVGIVGLFGDIVVSGEARSGKRIVIGGLPGDKTATVDQFYVDLPHRRHTTLRHGQQLWRLTQKLYGQAGTLRFVCSTATSKGHAFYLRMGFVVNPVARDLVLTISVTKLKL